MKIAVMSPGRGTGLTSVATLLSTTMSIVFNKQTLLLHSDDRNLAMNTYMASKSEYDPTRSLTQVVKLLEMNAISGENILDYAVPLAPQLSGMGNADEIISKSEHEKLLTFLLTTVEDNVDIVIDVATELDDPFTQSILDNVDFVVLVLTQDKVVLDRFTRWRASEYYQKLETKGAEYVVNMYNPVVSSLRGISTAIGVKHTMMCKIAYNPFIMKMGNEGNLPHTVDFILAKDFRVLDLNNDIHECMQVIAANQGLTCRWG